MGRGGLKMDRRREREEKKRRREEKEQRPRDPSTRSPQGPLRNSPTTSPQPCLRKVYYSLSNFTSASTGPSKGDYATSLVGRQRCPLFSSDIKLNYDLFKGRNSADSMRLRFDKKKKNSYAVSQRPLFVRVFRDVFQF